MVSNVSKAVNLGLFGNVSILGSNFSSPLDRSRCRDQGSVRGAGYDVQAVSPTFCADRWADATWRSLETQVGIEAEETPTAGVIQNTETEPPPEPTAGVPRAPRRKRRIYTPNFMR